MMPSPPRVALAFALVGALTVHPGTAPADEVAKDGMVLERERD